MYRYVNKFLPNVFQSYSTSSDTVHTYDTSQMAPFRPPYYRVKLGDHGVRYTGIEIWAKS